MRDDVRFLGLTRGDREGRFHFTVENHLARLDGYLYGGTAIAASLAVAEAVTSRTAVWMTTQFVATAGPGARVTVDVEVLAPGRRTNQVRVTGTGDDGATLFASLGSTGHHRDGGLAGGFERPPVVARPDETDGPTSPFAGVARRAGLDLELPPEPPDVGFHRMIELREPEILGHPDPGPGRVCLWARRRDGVPVTPVMAAYMADMVPLAISDACGELAGGISLDNSIRLGARHECEWVLLDLRPHLAVGDYGHGSVLVWTEDGQLLAAASQSASMFRFDAARPPWSDEG